MTLEDILCEVVTQGIAVCYGVNGFNADRIKTYDLTNQSPTYVVSTDLFVFGRGTNVSNQPSRNIKIRDYKRTDADAALSGFVDFKFTSASGASAQNVEFYGCTRNIAVNLLADLTNAFDVTINSSRITVSGTGITNLSTFGSTGFSADSWTLKGLQLTAEDLTLLATANNQAIGATTNLLRCTPSGASRNFSGIVAPSGATSTNPRLLYIYNIDAATTLTLLQDSTSVSANRFFCPGSANYDLGPRSGCVVAYDASVSRWVVLDK